MTELAQVAFISSASRTMHETIDVRIANARYLLNSDTAVRNAVGEPYVEQFNSFAENYFVPDIVDGRVKVPATEKYRDSHLVVALHSDDHIRGSADTAHFSFSQTSAIMRRLDSLGIGHKAELLLDLWRSTAEAVVDSPVYRFSLSQEKATAAVVCQSLLTNLDIFGLGAYDLDPRPFMLLSTKADGMVSDTLAITHELVHDVQFSTDPLRPAPSNHTHSRLEIEEPAYELTANLVRGLIKSGYPMTGSQKLMLEVPKLIRDTLEYGRTVDTEADLWKRLFSARLAAEYALKRTTVGV